MKAVSPVDSLNIGRSSSQTTTIDDRNRWAGPSSQDAFLFFCLFVWVVVCLSASSGLGTDMGINESSTFFNGRGSMWYCTYLDTGMILVVEIIL